MTQPISAQKMTKEPDAITKIVVGGADDGCDDIYCIACKKRFQIRYGGTIQFCPFCSRKIIEVIERKWKEYYQIDTSGPISPLRFAIVEKDIATGEEKIKYRQSLQFFDHRGARYDIYDRLLEYRKLEDEAREEWKDINWPQYSYHIVKMSN